jgi:hypothetical protein
MYRTGTQLYKNNKKSWYKIDPLHGVMGSKLPQMSYTNQANEGIFPPLYCIIVVVVPGIAFVDHNCPASGRRRSWANMATYSHRKYYTCLFFCILIGIFLFKSKMYMFTQCLFCMGNKQCSVYGSVCFLVSRIRPYPYLYRSTTKKITENHDFYCFVTSQC